jgi:hypothetical protein
MGRAQLPELGQNQLVRYTPDAGIGSGFEGAKQMETRQWKVTAYTGKNRNVLLGSSYVLADSESEAIDLGKQALRLIGVRGAFRVSATRYSPLRDLAFQGFVRAV